MLASPTTVENIATVRDMVKSNLPFLLSTAESIDEIPLLSRRAELRLQKRLTACPEPLANCLAKFVSVPQYCLSAYERDMAFAQAVLRNRQFHLLDRSKGAGVYLGMYMTKNHFLKRKLTTMILRLAQSGLTQHWFAKNLRTHLCDLNNPNWLLLRQADANQTEHGDANMYDGRPYTMTDLYPLFLIWALGMVLAGIAFITELLATVFNLRLTARFKRLFLATWRNIIDCL